MSTNYVQPGDRMEYSNSGSAISSGDIVVIGERIGVALVDIAATTGKGSVDLEGVFNLPKATGESWSQGDPLFYDSTADKLTKTATGNTPAGYAFLSAGSSDTTGNCRLNARPKQATNVTALAQDISPTYVESEVQAISSKVDSILSALKAAGLMANS